MGKASRIVAIVCILCQGALPAFACPCPSKTFRNTNLSAAKACARRAASEAVPKTAKSKCGRCARAKTCASKKAVAARPAKCATSASTGCAACPYRQASKEPVQPYVPTDNARDQAAAVPVALVAVLAEPADGCRPELSSAPEPGTDVASLHERLSQIVCWLK